MTFFEYANKLIIASTDTNLAVCFLEREKERENIDK